MKQSCTIDFTTQNTSFYLAIRDVTSCILISRTLIFYTVCPSEISDLTIRPETIAPIDSTLLQITTKCVPNANSGGSSQSISVCSQGGIWTTLPGQECTCNNVFFTMGQECIGCTAGEYFSFICQSCPANSNSTEEGVAVCPCFDGYYRAMGEEDLPCTSLPSAPRNIRVISVTNTSISLSWDPSEDLGGRDDFFYTLIAIERSTMEIKRMTTVEGSVTTGVLGNLAPRLAYQVYVIAENGITDQLGQSDRLQSLGTSVTVTVIGDTVITTTVPPTSIINAQLVVAATVPSVMVAMLLAVILVILAVLIFVYKELQTECSKIILLDDLSLPNVETSKNVAYETQKFNSDKIENWDVNVAEMSPQTNNAEYKVIELSSHTGAYSIGDANN